MKKREEEINKGRRIKIVEKSGVNLENILSMKYLFIKGKCTEKKCPLCANGPDKVKISCNTNNVGYR